MDWGTPSSAGLVVLVEDRRRVQPARQVLPILTHQRLRKISSRRPSNSTNSKPLVRLGLVLGLEGWEALADLADLVDLVEPVVIGVWVVYPRSLPK